MSAPTTTTPATYRVDPVHSSVGFAVKHMVVATFRARFEDFDATLVDDGGDLRLEGTVEAGSLQVKDENFKAHLDSPEFFDVANHPQLRFASATLQRSGDQVTVEGELTIKGITKPISATGAISGPHENVRGIESIGLSLQTTLVRQDYGLNWNAPLPKGGFALADEVTLVVDLEFAKDS